MRWRRMAIAIARRHPSWSTIEVASAVQHSPAARKWGGPLKFSVDHISKHIQGIVSMSEHTMSQPFKILMVEDAAADAELIVRELKRAGIDCDTRRVQTAGDYQRELDEFQPQLILSDFSMPKFDGLRALTIARRSYPHIPFVFVSGTLGEENAVRALQGGATDYVLKDNLIRLPAAVQRAMKDVRERGVRQAVVNGLQDSERCYREVFQNNPHPMWVYDVETLRFLLVNDTAVARYGFSREEFLAMTINEILPERYQGIPEEFAVKHRTKGGDLVEVSVASHEIQLEHRRARIVVASQA
jgi:CheY-like chemotaxis protein